ncbi:MAG: glucose 1-dehydrogenase [Nitrospirota bacterium]|nr:glucose 1-dehydrogenase [Nitrospirota bacterium]
MKGRLHGKSALITGGGTGIGAGIARRFVAEGARVTITGRREAPLRELARELGCDYAVGDVSSSTDAAAMVQSAVAAHGGLDVVVNNAGVARFSDLAATTDEVLEMHLGINVRGPYCVTRAALPHLLERRGNVLFISSTLAMRGIPGGSAYGASKGAVNALTLHLAAELSPRGVRVNCICPAVVETPIFETMMSLDDAAKVPQSMASIHPIGRVGQPTDVAGAALYLVSDEAAWVTGAVLTVDGGVTAV